MIIINNRVSTNCYQGMVTALTTLLKVGYLMSMTVKWKQKKKGWTNVPITDNAPYPK